MGRYRLTESAQADIMEILAWSQTQFGEEARRRYEALIIAALRDVATHPEGAGTTPRPELGDGVRSWHLRLTATTRRPQPCTVPATSSSTGSTATRSW